MNKSYETKDEVIQYSVSHSLRQDPIHKELHEKSRLQFPDVALMIGAPEVVQLFCNILRAIGGKKFIDVGMFTGYSSVGAALALPEDGKVIGCEVNEEFVNFGRPFWKKAGVEHKIHVNLQPALQTLDDLIANGEDGTFDMAFIDADKENYTNYFERCLTLIRPGGVIAVDNVLWDNLVLDPKDQQSTTVAIRALNEKLAKDDRIHISFLTTGDGVTLAFKK